jgi:hypothetical protein
MMEGCNGYVFVGTIWKSWWLMLRRAVNITTVLLTLTAFGVVFAAA